MPRGGAAPIRTRRIRQTPSLDPIAQLDDHEARILGLEREPRTPAVPPYTIGSDLHVLAPIDFTPMHVFTHRFRIWQVWFGAGTRVSSDCQARLSVWDDPETLVESFDLTVAAGDYATIHDVNGGLTVKRFGYYTVSALVSSGDPADWTLGVTNYRDE